MFPSSFGSKRSDAPRPQGGASRQLKLIFHSVPIHSRQQGGALSAHTDKRNKDK
jgi:hypothetical protein